MQLALSKAVEERKQEDKKQRAKKAYYAGLQQEYAARTLPAIMEKEGEKRERLRIERLGRQQKKEAAVQRIDEDIQQLRRQFDQKNKEKHEEDRRRAEEDSAQKQRLARRNERLARNHELKQKVSKDRYRPKEVDVAAVEVDVTLPK